MMKQNPFLQYAKRLAQIGLENQKINDGDYYDKNGYLVCGKCNERRQCTQEFSTGEEGTCEVVKVACKCKCEREKQEAEERVKQKREDVIIINKLKEASMMDERFVDATFENCKTNKYNQRNMNLCKRYATAFDKMLEKCQGLLFWGNVGTGKSYAAAAIANYLLEQKINVVMTSLTKILSLIDANRSEESAIGKKLQRAELVIFDDFGAERATDYALEKVYNIIDERYRTKLPMILTTNLTLNEMKTETDIRYARIFDRIFETCYPMQFTGPSWRKVTASNRFNEMKKFLEGE